MPPSGVCFALGVRNNSSVFGVRPGDGAAVTLQLGKRRGCKRKRSRPDFYLHEFHHRCLQARVNPCGWVVLAGGHVAADAVRAGQKPVLNVAVLHRDTLEVCNDALCARTPRTHMCVIGLERALQTMHERNITLLVTTEEAHTSHPLWKHCAHVCTSARALKKVLAQREPVRTAAELALQLPVLLTLASLSHMTLQDVLAYSAPMRSACVLLAVAKARDPQASLPPMALPVPLRLRAAHAPQPCVGGLVLDPPAQHFHRSVCVLDFKSMYPTIASEWNICCTTLRKQASTLCVSRALRLPTEIADVVCAFAGPIAAEAFPASPQAFLQCSGQWWWRPRYRRGLLSQAMQDFVAWRNASACARERAALKLAANSLIGACGALRSPCYDRAVFQAILLCGRALLRSAARLAQQQGARVVYGDTDSIFVVASPAQAAALADVFQSRHRFRHVRLQRQHCFERFFQFKKKAYIGWDGAVHTTGVHGVADKELTRRLHSVFRAILFESDAREALERECAGLPGDEARQLRAAARDWLQAAQPALVVPQTPKQAPLPHARSCTKHLLSVL